MGSVINLFLGDQLPCAEEDRPFSPGCIFAIIIEYKRGNFTTKKILFLKNLTVIISGVVVLLILPIIYNLQTDTIYGIFVFSISLLLFSYEILKDIHDIEGDRAVGIKTIVMITSPSTTAKIATSLFMSSCLLISLAFFTKNYLLEATISFATAFIILIPSFNLIKSPSQQNSEKLRYVIVSIILISLTIVGGLLLNRNLERY